MMRSHLALVLVLGLAVAVAGTACRGAGGGGAAGSTRKPGAGGGAPVILPALLEAPSVLGSTWTGVSDACDRSGYRFDPDGVLHYEMWDGVYDNGTWKQTGAYLYLDMRASNRVYAEFQGVLTGDFLAGRWVDVDGTVWTWDGVRHGSAADEQGLLLSCTTWRGTYGAAGAEMIATFHPAGRFAWQDEAGYADDGRWSADGTRVTVVLDGGRATFHGDMADARLNGAVIDRDGKPLAWTLVREAPPRAAPLALAGTRWTGWGADQTYLAFVLAVDGAATVTSGDLVRQGAWQIDGALLHVSADDVEYWGTLAAGQLHGNGRTRDEEWFRWEVVPAAPLAPATPAVPAGLAAAPDAATPATPRASLTDTVWDGDLDGDAVVLHFHGAGALRIESAAGARTGSWRQSGATVYVTLDDDGMAWDGVIDAANDTLAGRAWNRHGDKWSWRVHRRP